MVVVGQVPSTRAIEVIEEIGIKNIIITIVVEIAVTRIEMIMTMVVGERRHLCNLLMSHLKAFLLRRGVLV